MTYEDHLLVCLAEECNEVAHRVAKALRFGLGEVQAGQNLTNAERIVEEMRDLRAVFSMLQVNGVFAKHAKYYTDIDGEAYLDAKSAKIHRYMKISRAQGTLRD